MMTCQKVWKQWEISMTYSMSGLRRAQVAAKAQVEVHIAPKDHRTEEMAVDQA
jgi:hypothetical protein